MKKSTRRAAINLGVILLVSIGCTFFFATGKLNVSSILLNTLYGILIGLSIALGSTLITRLIFKDESVYENPTMYYVLAVVGVAVYIFLDLLVLNYFWFSITQGLSFGELMSSPFGFYTITIEFVIGLLIYLVALARFFTRDLKKYYSKVVETESQLARYQYDTLKNQLNPHFLFNALNTLSGLIYLDVDRADEFIHRLSKLYRYVLDVQQEEIVTIQTELELVKDFLYLNNIRFNNQIKESIRVKEDVDGFIAPMALQLLIENAIKHNIISESAPLMIEIIQLDGKLEVRNNVQLKQEKEPSHELGLKNLRDRYAVLTDQAIEIEATKDFFTVRVPIIEKELK